MKLKNYIFVFLFFAFQSLSAQTTYYYYYNQKKYIDIDREFVAVNAVTNQNFLQSYASSYSSKTDFYKSTVRTSVTPVDSLAISRVSLQNYYSELQLTAAIKNDTLNYQNFINTLHQNPDVIKVSPCIRTAGGSLVGLTNYFYVKLHTATDESILYTLAQNHNLEVVGKNPYMPLWYAISCTKQNPLSVLEYANLFYESGFFEAAEPEFVYHGGSAGSSEPLQSNAQSTNSVVSSPNDMFYEDQWGLKNTGQHNGTPGIDIKAEQAWAFIQNNVPAPATIKIAIYDEGFDTYHPDLMGNMLAIPSGYDINSPETGNSILRAGQHHGTHCAGIAGAVQNNIGISGVAPQAKLVSISHDSDNRTSEQIAAGFTWARDNGIDVISCSWDANGIESAQITNAINSAINNGRGGLGCVVVFCSGNSPDFTHNIVYPASSELVPNVLVVGAITPCGKRKSPPHTCEIGSGNPNYSIGLWQSRYGSRLDVVAPGVRIPTTDAQGTTGNNPEDEENPVYFDHPNYWSNFDGTSAATPHVAGIAALVLSVNPQLTAVQVNDIIEKTAQKVGGYDYSQTTGRPNGTWHQEMGYGLVDAYAAVQLAKSMATLDLMVKDSQEDLGIEPNTITQYFWASPDIWIRNQDDGGLFNQNPEYSPTIPNYAYIRITNKSLVASTGNEQLKFYWAKAGTSLSWPDSWDGTSTFANNALKGDEVGTVNIPVIQPGQTTIVKMSFLVPNPADYSFAGSEQWHFCLLARIVATNDLMTFTETTDLVSNVSKNNNIAWKNVTIVDAIPNSEGKLGGVIAVGNPFDEIRTFNLNFEADNKETGKLIFEEAEITIHLDNILANAWDKGGKQGNNIKFKNENTLIVTGDKASLDKLIFDNNEVGTLFLQFNFLTKEITGKEIYKYHVIQRHTSTNDILGGETYEIRKNPRGLFYADAGDDKNIDINETIVLNAEPINEPAVYNWYDNEGNLIYEGVDFEVSAAMAKKYKLEIIALSDGYKDYSEIEVKLNPNRIENVYPNPSSNQITTTYKINEGGSAYIAITGFYGSNISNNYILDITQSEITVDISSYPQGLYNIALIVNGQISDTKTLVKQ